MADMHPGSRIKAWRTKRELTPAQLADLVGVSRPAVVQWEDESTNPSQEHLIAVVNAFGITMSRFYGPLPAVRKAA